MGSPTWGEEWDLKEDGVEKPEGSNPPGPSPAPPEGDLILQVLASEGQPPWPQVPYLRSWSISAPEQLRDFELSEIQRCL